MRDRGRGRQRKERARLHALSHAYHLSTPLSLCLCSGAVLHLSPTQRWHVVRSSESCWDAGTCESIHTMDEQRSKQDQTERDGLPCRRKTQTSVRHTCAVSMSLSMYSLLHIDVVAGSSSSAMAAKNGAFSVDCLAVRILHGLYMCARVSTWHAGLASASGYDSSVLVAVCLLGSTVIVWVWKRTRRIACRASIVSSARIWMRRRDLFGTCLIHTCISGKG